MEITEKFIMKYGVIIYLLIAYTLGFFLVREERGDHKGFMRMSDTRYEAEFPVRSGLFFITSPIWIPFYWFFQTCEEASSIFD